MTVESNQGAQAIPPGRGDPRPKPRPDRAERSRETRQRATERVDETATTNAEVLRQLGKKATEVPPEKDLVQIGVAAAKFSLTNLESARLIAEQIRAEIELDQSDRVVNTAQDGAPTTRDRISAALTG